MEGGEAGVIVVMADGSMRTVPVVTDAAMIVAIVLKADAERIPLPTLMADYYWHAVAHALGTIHGWRLGGRLGVRLPLPRVGITRRAYLRALQEQVASESARVVEQADDKAQIT